MPKNKSESNRGQNAKGKAAPRTPRRKDAELVRQTDLFDDLNVELVEPAAIPVPPKSPKPRTTRPKPTATATATKQKQPKTHVSNTKQYIQKLPYTSVLVIGYVALVLAWDMLVTVGDKRTINWAVFQWRPADLQALLLYLHVPQNLLSWMGSAFLAQVDLFKMLFWLVIPVAICFWRMDWDYLSRRRIKPADWWFLGGMCALGVAAVVAVKFIPVLNAQYGGLGQVALSVRLKFMVVQLFWVASWLPGWEFMHRYFLLRRVSVDFPKYGWLLLPLAEGAYHLSKPWPEMLAMVAFSVIMTQYTLLRRNIVIPFLAHLAVEVFLILGMMTW